MFCPSRMYNAFPIYSSAEGEAREPHHEIGVKKEASDFGRMLPSRAFDPIGMVVLGRVSIVQAVGEDPECQIGIVAPLAPAIRIATTYPDPHKGGNANPQFLVALHLPLIWEELHLCPLCRQGAPSGLGASLYTMIDDIVHRQSDQGMLPGIVRVLDHHHR